MLIPADRKKGGRTCPRCFALYQRTRPHAQSWEELLRFAGHRIASITSGRDDGFGVNKQSGGSRARYLSHRAEAVAAHRPIAIGNVRLSLWANYLFQSSHPGLRAGQQLSARWSSRRCSSSPGRKVSSTHDAGLAAHRISVQPCSSKEPGFQVVGIRR